MRYLLLTIACLSIMACAPEDKPLKGSKNSPQPENKIQESAYNGSNFDVVTYAAYRILEPKRVMNMALLWLRPTSKMEFGKNSGYKLLKSCWGGKNDVYIDVLKDTPQEVEFVLNFDNCTSLSSFQLSTKIFGREYYKLKFAASEDSNGNSQRLYLESVDYRTLNFRHLFKANDKNLRFSSSSSAELSEERNLRIQLRSNSEYYYSYFSQGVFQQNLNSKSFKVIENEGRHNYFVEGNFFILRNKVVGTKHTKIELEHSSPREVSLRTGSQRQLFVNERNRLFLTAENSELPLSFERDCGFINGELQNIYFKNDNQKRNQFFEKVDSQLSEKLMLVGERIKGSNPRVTLRSGSKFEFKKEAKCYINSSNLVNLSQPKTPFDLIFIR